MRSIVADQLGLLHRQIADPEQGPRVAVAERLKSLNRARGFEVEPRRLKIGFDFEYSPGQILAGNAHQSAKLSRQRHEVNPLHC